MIDEVQCGMGPHRQVVRAPVGRHHADVMPLAKGPGFGRADRRRWWPDPKAANIFQPGNHGTTFGGNRWRCAPASNDPHHEEDGLLDNAARRRRAPEGALARELGGLAGVTEIRGQGLMLGVELAKPCGVLTQRAARAGLLISVTADNVIRLVPPLIMTEAEADEIVAILAPLVQGFLANDSHDHPALPAVQRPHGRRVRAGCSSARPSSRRSSRPTRSTTRWPTARWR
jgi:acetylornithine aminotransferase